MTSVRTPSSLKAPLPLRIIAILIVLGLLFFGLLRLGIGIALLAAEHGWWQPWGELAEALADTRVFMAEKGPQAIFAWSASFYLSLIAVMGAVLAAGSAFYLAGRRKAGLVLIAIYIALHGSMFVNFLLINHKIWILLASTGLWAILLWRHRAEGRAPSR